MFNWFDSSEAKTFGDSLAGFYIERSAAHLKASKKKKGQKTGETIDKMFQQVAQFRAAHKLNIYKKAKLGNAFKWRLLEAGYDSEFVNELTHMLMVRL
ncbi:hypothetical protein [Undibacterium terreum]|uniref:Uncharacterized protein n=1 Tax=Undibacterium terreum TaxID=1224302 RepID=A0A916URL7_9BURK|nr:hypothetical protein [Undibacterium terreum]GGC83904.1 hypothetical protein GCM10011396_34100 [Undibacterium terreum]